MVSLSKLRPLRAAANARRILSPNTIEASGALFPGADRRLFSESPSLPEPSSSSPMPQSSQPRNGSPAPSSLNRRELAKFAAIAETWSAISILEFRISVCNYHRVFHTLEVVFFFFLVIRWDSEGPFKPLHAMNPTRLAFIRSTLCRHFG